MVFPTVEDVVPEKCPPLVARLVEGCKQGPIALIADVPVSLRGVMPSMVSFWLEALNRKDLDVRVVAVVTKSLAVRVAVKAVDAAMKIRNKPIVANTTATRDEAVRWAEETLATHLQAKASGER
jgi:hypothetical protein